MSRPDIAAGGRLRERVGSRNAAPIFAGLGVLLVAVAVAIPEFQTLLLAWGGTALFVALLLRFVVTGRTVSAAVTSDIYAVMAGNARRVAGAAPHRYVPDADGVTLAVGDRSFDPVGERLAATVPESGPDAAVADRLAVLVDVVVNDLELAARASATPTDDGATVTITDSAVGTTQLFDHPVASLVGVELAEHLDRPVTVESSANGDRLVVTCRWSEPTEELLDGPSRGKAQEDERADQ